MYRNWAAYVKSAAKGLAQKDIAAATHIDTSVISRWLDPDNASQPRADKVIAFARALNADPVKALVAAGYMNIREVKGAKVFQPNVHDMRLGELLNHQAEVQAEVSRRYHDAVAKKNQPCNGDDSRVNRQAPPV